MAERSGMPGRLRRFGQDLALRLACAASYLPTARSDVHAVQVMGLQFAAPVGVAAGFDPCGRLGRRAVRLGFGFTEIGSCSLVRMLELVPDQPGGSGLIGINLSLDPRRTRAELCAGLSLAWAQADYLMLNLINPLSAPLLADDQRPRLTELLRALRNRGRALDSCGARRVPMAVKLRSLPGQVPLALTELLLQLGFDGVLAAHDPGPPATAERYLGWQHDDQQHLACQQIEQLRQLCGDELALMSVGGVQTADHLRARMAAGAQLVQVHSALLREGPFIARRLLPTG